MNRKVSIIVPVYNSHKTLPKCLDSLVSQTYQDLEIICVNDKSSDNSVDIIKEYKQKDPRIILIDHEENKNAGGARNSGIKAATGTYVCFVDNDDWMTEDAVEIMIKESDDCQIDFVCPNWCIYYNKKNIVPMTNLIVGASMQEHQERILKNGCRILWCLIRKDIILKNNLFFPEKMFFEDNAVGMAIVFSAKRIMAVNKVLYFYYMIEGSSSRLINMTKLIDRVKTTDMFYNNMSGLGFITPENKLLVDRYYLQLSLNTISILLSLNDSSSCTLLFEVMEKIKPKLPNPYIKLGFEWKLMLSHPLFYFHVGRKIISLLRNYTPQSIKHIFRKIRPIK